MPIGGGEALSLSLKPLPILKRILRECVGLVSGVDCVESVESLILLGCAESMEVSNAESAFFALFVVAKSSGRLSQVREPSA